MQILLLQSTPQCAERIGEALTAAGIDAHVRLVPSREQLAAELAAEACDAVALEAPSLAPAGSEIDALREAHRAAQAEAESASRLKDQFLSSLSHELRTPLNAIVGWATLLLETPMGPTEQREALEIIERNARLQTRIINDLLDMNRVLSRTGQQEPRANLIDEVELGAGPLRPDAAAKRLQFETHVEPGLPQAEVDPERLRQVVRILLGSAIKTTAVGGRIALDVKRAGSAFEMRITGSGHSISAELAQLLAERPTALGSSRGDGESLELEVVERLVARDRGSLAIEQPGQLGQGPIYVVRLPLCGVLPATITS